MPAKPAPGGKTILVVDDDDLLRQVLTGEMRRLGYVTLQAGSGHEAFALVKEKNVDLVLSDVRMPNGTGIELLDLIRARGERPKVLLISGYTDISEAEAVGRGALGLLEKPFDRQRLMDLIESALS